MVHLLIRAIRSKKPFLLNFETNNVALGGDVKVEARNIICELCFRELCFDRMSLLL